MFALVIVIVVVKVVLAAIAIVIVIVLAVAVVVVVMVMAVEVVRARVTVTVIVTGIVIAVAIASNFTNSQVPKQIKRFQSVKASQATRGFDRGTCEALHLAAGVGNVAFLDFLGEVQGEMELRQSSKELRSRVVGSEFWGIK